MATQNSTDTPKLVSNGQLIIGSGTAQPVAASLTAPAAGISITGGAGSITFALTNDLSGVEGLSTTGYAIRTGDGTWICRSLTATSSKIALTNADGIAAATGIDVTEANLTLNNIGGTLQETKGGTNQTTYTTGDILYASAGNTLSKLAIGTNTQVLTSNGTIPGWAAAAAGGLSWSEVTGTSQAGAVNSGYLANNAALVTVTLPDTAALFSIIRVVGKGAGLFRIAQNASEIIHFDSVNTTTGVGGYVEATNRYDVIQLMCTIANTEWTIVSSIGNFTYV